MKLKEVLDKTTAFFREKKFETPRLDSELLIAHGLGLDRIQLYLKFDQPLQESELKHLRELVRRRAQGEPVAYILGYRDFFGERFCVDNSTLIPRPETEHLIEEVLNWTSDKNSFVGILDLGCGSGCIGLSLLKCFPNAKCLLVDFSEKAIEIAKLNAEKLGLTDRAFFLSADANSIDEVMNYFRDIFGKEKIDILVSNPPYIAENDPEVEKNVKKFEPSSALFAKDDGLFLLKKWSASYGTYLNVNSIMAMEMGMSQGKEMKAHFENMAIFNQSRVIKDLSGHDRIICGVKNG